MIHFDQYFSKGLKPPTSVDIYHINSQRVQDIFHSQYVPYRLPYIYGKCIDTQGCTSEGEGKRMMITTKRRFVDEIWGAMRYLTLAKVC